MFIIYIYIYIFFFFFFFFFFTLIVFNFLRMGHHVITIRFYCSPTSKITVDQQLCWASVVIRWLCEACSVKQHIPSFSNEAARQSSSLSLSLSLQTLAHCFLCCVYVCLFFHSSHRWLNSSYRNKQETGGKRYCHRMCCCRFRESVWNLSNPTGSTQQEQVYYTQEQKTRFSHFIKTMKVVLTCAKLTMLRTVDRALLGGWQCSEWLLCGC